MRQEEDFDANLAGDEGKSEETKTTWFKRIKKGILTSTLVAPNILTSFSIMITMFYSKISAPRISLDSLISNRIRNDLKKPGAKLILPIPFV